jgi:hypothetical protein
VDRGGRNREAGRQRDAGSAGAETTLSQAHRGRVAVSPLFARGARSSDQTATKLRGGRKSSEQTATKQRLYLLLCDGLTKPPKSSDQTATKHRPFVAGLPHTIGVAAARSFSMVRKRWPEPYRPSLRCHRSTHAQEGGVSTAGGSGRRPLTPSRARDTPVRGAIVSPIHAPRSCCLGSRLQGKTNVSDCISMTGAGLPIRLPAQAQRNPARQVGIPPLRRGAGRAGAGATVTPRPELRPAEFSRTSSAEISRSRRLSRGLTLSDLKALRSTRRTGKRPAR